MNRVNIEAERARLQMTKTDMCRELGVTLKTYNGYIRGSTVPSNVLEQLREMTGCSIDYLLGVGVDNLFSEDRSSAELLDNTRSSYSRKSHEGG